MKTRPVKKPVCNQFIYTVTAILLILACHPAAGRLSEPGVLYLVGREAWEVVMADLNGGGFLDLLPALATWDGGGENEKGESHYFQLLSCGARS